LPWGGSCRRECAAGETHPWTVEDFLAFEAEEPERYEFVGGIVRMMTGGSATHGAIKGNLAVALDEALRKSTARPYLSDLKVVTASAAMYPDVLVTCRPLAPDDDRLSDPTVAVEVLLPARPSIGSTNGVSTRESPRSGSTS
jgi:Uma2 family endonuclease